MSTVITQITMVTKKDVSDEDEQELLESKNVDSLDAVAEGMEPALEQRLKRMFRDAEIAILDVNTEVEE